MQKELLLALALSTIIITASLVLIKNSSPSKSEIDSATNQAKYIYTDMKARGMDFSQGPCLSNALMEDWVLDIVHKPRLPIDDLSENMCPAYKEGRAKHFVELDVDGNLIRAR